MYGQVIRFLYRFGGGDVVHNLNGGGGLYCLGFLCGVD